MAQKNYTASYYIGYTSRGVPAPVFFNTHTPIFNDKTPGILVTGYQGSGKTNFMMTLAVNAGIIGQTVVAIDHKGDFTKLDQLQDELGPVNICNIGADENAGFLDPFSLTQDEGEKRELIISAVELFVGGVTADERTALSPIVKDLTRQVDVGLGDLVLALRSSPNNDARNLGTRLDIIQCLPTAKVAFTPFSKLKDKTPIDITTGITVISTQHLDMPKDNSEAVNTNSGRLASGVMFLLLTLLKKLVVSDTTSIPKLVIIDEAWNLVSSNVGKALVKSFVLLGRSRSLATVLGTQEAKHIATTEVDKTIGVRFAFKNSEDEGVDTVKAMRLPANHGFETLLPKLQPGECLMSDWYGDYGFVQIDNWNKKWADVFDTNPLSNKNVTVQKQ